VNRLPARRVDQLVALFEAGASGREAARVAGVGRRTAHRYQRIWRAAAPPATVLIGRLDPDTRRRLSEEAVARGLGDGELAAAVLAVVLRDRLVSSILW
jgi:hypothetical protein